MMTFPLALRRIESAAPPAAWLIPGADPQTWIDELSRWGVPMENLRLYVLPRSLQDPSLMGILVTDTEALTSVRASRAQPYRLLADRLYIPADAELDPAVSDAELHKLLIWEMQVLHPGAGLIGCSRDEGLEVSDLLVPPPSVDVAWDRAARPPVYAPRLLSVEAELPPTLETILEQGRDGIGSESLEQLPPDESESALDRMMARASRPGLKFIQWLSSGGAPGGAGEGWKKKLREWVGRQMQKVDQTLQDARLKELRRLQKLFESNPDEALRFALPFRDTGRRGHAPPGGRLPARNPFFDMNRLSGGRPGDSWTVPPDTQRDLLTRYRAAANRELNLRRYRRAAYVFAELLGDFSAAANALVQGRYYREAATLYRDRLNNLAAAAKCLRDGGLLLEAVVIYEQMGEYEVAGDLHAAVDHRDDAGRCYREALKRAIDRDAHLDAARLLQTKLDSPDEALALLRSQWPGSQSATACLTAYFDLLEKLNRHEETSLQIAGLRDQLPRDDRAQPLAEVLSTIATRHPSPGVRSLAADATRVVAGRRLAEISGSEAKMLVTAVTRLRPDDRLLIRDGSRFLTPSPKTYKLAPAADKPKLISEFQLPGNIILSSAISTGTTFFAIGRENRERTVIFRGTWFGKFQKMNWPGNLDATRCILEPGPSAQTLLLIPLSRPPQGNLADAFPPADGFPERCRVTIPRWLPHGTIIGSGEDEGFVLWISHTTKATERILCAFSCETGHLLKTRGPIQIENPVDWKSAVVPTPVVARSGHVFFATGRTMVHLLPGSVGINKQAERVHVLPQKCMHVVGSPAFTRVRVAAAFEEGGVVLWDEGTQQPFAQGMDRPRIGFTRGGFLIAANRKEVRVYRADGFTICRHRTFAIDGMDPIAVCAAPKLNDIGLIGSNGLVRVFEISPHLTS